MSATTSPPNGYDLSVAKWLDRNHGYIKGYCGSFKLHNAAGDEHDALRVTPKMIERLSEAGLLRRRFLKGQNIHEETWSLKL